MSYSVSTRQHLLGTYMFCTLDFAHSVQERAKLFATFDMIIARLILSNNSFLLLDGRAGGKKGGLATAAVRALCTQQFSQQLSTSA